MPAKSLHVTFYVDKVTGAVSFYGLYDVPKAITIIKLADHVNRVRLLRV